MSKPAWLPSFLRGLVFTGIAVVLLYPLSICPASILCNRVPSERFRESIMLCYAPLAFVIRDTPLKPIIDRYADWSMSLVPEVPIPDPIKGEAPPIPAP